MLNAPTLEQLHALKLSMMATAWTEQQQQADMTALAFDERFALLVEAEWRARENTRLARALHDAKLKLSQACIEAIDYPARRELDKAVIRQLATCRWIDEHQQVLVTGATGTGKSFIACALAQQACRRGYRAYYRRASSMISAWRAPTAPTAGSSPSSRGWTSSCSTPGAWPRPRTRSAATSSRSSRIAMGAAPRSSRASSPRPVA
jgi:DNA replication protein DnaC